ncbi:MAG: DUF4810 domain-containing protein [Planctomycetota bacterium]|nr:MAG: DUF4810 domain-containing protein [Planctomycetota bacterium]
MSGLRRSGAVARAGHAGAGRGFRHFRRGVVLLLCSLAFVSCASRIYNWGPYESSVLNSLQDFNRRALLEEIDRLEEHDAELRRLDLPAMPGFHAQLGYLHYLAGNGEAAVRHFQAEKTFFPESSVFIDGMLERVK